MSKMQKIILGSLMVLVLLTGLAWKIFVLCLLAGVQGLLLSQVNSSINGRIEIEAVDFSLLGAAVLKKVFLFDQNGANVAAGEEIDIRYKIGDLLAG